MRRDHRRALSKKGFAMGMLRGCSPLICAAVLCFVAASTASAESLGDLRGVWARSAADCRVLLTGQLNKMSHAEAGKYEMVGICRKGFGLIAEAVACEASDIDEKDGRYTFTAECGVKGQPVKFRSGLWRREEVISFDERDFNQGFFTISGDYIRCTREYKCER
jgi:hypothetical protein